MKQEMIKLVKASIEDCDLYFKWVNDPLVRKNSFSSAPIKYQDHQEWFRKKIESENSILLKGLLQDKPIGQVRIEIEDTKGIVNYSIDQKYRSNNYGYQLISAAIDFLKKNSNCEFIEGRVKLENIPSQKIFNKLNFIEKKLENEFIYSKKL